MSVVNAIPLLAAAGGDYQISRSVRLRSSASAYFNRTPAGAGNRTVWTWSGWVKRGSLAATNQELFTAWSDGSNISLIRFNASNQLEIGNYVGGAWVSRLITTAVYRDPSSWYHVVVSSNGSSSLSLYVNGVQVTSFGTTVGPAATNWFYNAAVLHQLGTTTAGGSAEYFDGYLTEVNFIDGQALTPSSFGETDAVTGVWKPKKYAGTYGTNGFYLNFSDNSAATAAAIGKDYSGNGNNWTPNNISVTAGVTYDSMVDVPTMFADGNGGRGNYAVLNPMGVPFSNGTVTDGNLKFAGLTTTDKGVAATISISSGAFYWESTQLSNSGASNCYAGVILTGASSDVNANRVYVRGDGIIYKYGTSLGAVFPTFTNNDVIGFAYDRANNTLAIYKNGTLGYTVTGLTNADHTPWVGGYTTTDSWAINFGQRPFTYTPPTGFKALNTQNLPEATIKKGNQYFDVNTWTGTGATQSITNGGFQPDLVWVKSRSAVAWHNIVDAVRGLGNTLFSNATDAETAISNQVTALNSNGFTLGADTNGGTNYSGRTYVGWQWKESVTAGFDIVTYTGNQTAGKAVPHSLGVAPAMIIVKARGQATSWPVYHQSLGATKWLLLNSTQAVTTTAQEWDNQPPSSTNFYVGNSSSNSNQSTTYVAYLFSEVAGYSKFGSYTGNGSADGVFVYTGFKPRFIMVKRTDAAGNNWIIIDTARDTYNAGGLYLYPNLSAAEDDYRASTGPLDVLSNGFKQRSSLSNVNASGATYVYACFAENPFKTSLAR